MNKSKSSFAWLFSLIASISLLLLVVFSHSSASAAGEFITTWKTDVTNGTDSTLTIPTFGNAVYDYTIDWGDGTVQNNVTGTAAHTYALPGTYQVQISGTYPRIYINFSSDRFKLQSIDAWGNNEWKSMRKAFAGAENVVITATDTPDLSQVYDVNEMFFGAKSLTSGLANWDVSKISNFSYMLAATTNYNENLDNWVLDGARNMEGLFYQASAYNQPMPNWDVSRVTNFNSTFRLATSFNQSLPWNVSSATDMRFMFQGASAFDQNIGTWDINSLTRADFMFDLGILSAENYDALLAGWLSSAAQPVTLTFSSSTYCQSGLIKQQLIDTYGWTISDGGFDGSKCGPTDISILNQLNPSVDENENGAIIGTFSSVDVEQNQVYIYGLTCTGNYPDNAFFTISSNDLVAATSFNFEDPQDENQDNIYNICVVSTDSDGFFIEKEFSVAVNDVDDPITNNDETTVEDGQVLSASTGSSSSNSSSSDSKNIASQDGETLGASDEPEVLATTGFSTNMLIATGGILSLAAIYVTTILDTSVVYKLKR